MSNNPHQIAETTIVDCDVHLTPRAPEFRHRVAPRLSEPYRSQVDPDVEMTYSDPYPGGGWPRSMGGKLSPVRQMVTDPSDIQEPLCEDWGVDYPLINTFIFPEDIPVSERGIQEVQALNEILLEDFLGAHDHFLGAISVPTQRPDLAVDEIEKYGSEDQVVAVSLVNSGTTKPLGDPMYDPMYEAAERMGLTMVYHPASPHISQWEFPVLQRDLETLLSGHVLSFPFSNMLHLTSLIVQGTPVKFPDLNFVFVESGLGWVPTMMGRLNREYAERRSEAPLLEKSPEEYIRDQFYFGGQPLDEFNDHENMKRVLDIIGADSLVFTSDHPHWDSDTPKAMEKYISHFSEEDREKVLYRNAAELFGLDI